MLKIIAVDDESTALKWFHRIALKNPAVSVEGEFLYAEDAIAFIRKHPADVAFIDIEMPEMSGLELAERLMDIDPMIKIVFITAYNQYALDAFRAHAIGYLLKPLDSEEFAEQIALLNSRYAQMPVKSSGSMLYVRCFGQFSVSTEAKEASIRWKTAKSEELFALLIHHQGKVKPRESLTETLWPELDPKKAANLFHVTCTYLRNTLADLGFPHLLLRGLDGYMLNTDLINCDLFSFKLMAQSISAQQTDKLKEALALYSGEYLEDKAYEWALGTRVQLESCFKNMQYHLSDEYSAANLYEKACNALEQILRYDTCDEEAVTRLIKMRISAGDNAAAAKTYSQYESAVKAELGVQPSDKLKELLTLACPQRPS